ncbi:hypothetical protein [Leptotrichia hongkongensis]|uniref:hypothetical protein n=1 Tax=Leptotrichia hongkongensis TaxID=554406 RepID=UPI0035A8D334
MMGEFYEKDFRKNFSKYCKNENRRSFENKILVHFEYEKSYSEKFGIIEKFDNEKIT